MDRPAPAARGGLAADRRRPPVFLGREFEKIQDLETLASLCGAFDSAFVDLGDKVALITSFDVLFRYPGLADPTAGQALEALAAG